MKQTTLQSILDDLYALDPTFRDYEKELTLILSDLIHHKPEVKIDERFVRELRANLTRKTTNEQEPSSSFIFQLLSMKNMLIPVGGLAIVLALGSAIYLSNPTRFAMNTDTASLAALPQFTNLGSDAFGSLAQLSSDAGTQSTSRSASGSGFASGEIATLDSREATSLIAPAIVYTYTYAGEPLTIEEEKLNVYRRVKSLSGAESVTKSAQGVAQDLMKMSKLGASQIHSFVLNQNAKDGYVTTVDFAEGRISITPNNSWYAETREYRPVSIGEVPADDRIIALADAFLENYGIDRSKYGAPIVDSRWREMYAIAERQGETPYVPDMITVTYPAIVGGEMVYETSGDAAGLRVTVDVRRKKVQSLWNLTSERYEQSAYQVEQDVDRVLMVAEHGGMHGGWYYGGSEVKELSLGTPDTVYIQQYRHNSANNTGEELFVPALRFPITDMPEDQAYMNRYVFVPLVKDILDEYKAPEQMPDADGPVRIMPVEEPMILELR